MSEERQETVADIVKEIRGNAEHNHALVYVSKYLTEISDRIEAADKLEHEATCEESSAVGNAAANRQFREVTKMIPHEEDVSKMETTTPTSEKSSQVGNAAAMREALNKILWCLEWMSNNAENKIIKDHLAKPIELAKSALSAPPRNCDVLSDTQKALAAIHEDRCYVNNPIDERRLTVEWLFAEAKGATDGSK